MKEFENYGENEVYKDSGACWLLKSSTDHIHEDGNESISTIKKQPMAMCESQKAPRKSPLSSAIEEEPAEQQAKDLTIRVAELQRHLSA